MLCPVLLYHCTANSSAVTPCDRPLQRSDASICNPSVLVTDPAITPEMSGHAFPWRSCCTDHILTSIDSCKGQIEGRTHGKLEYRKRSHVGFWPFIIFHHIAFSEAHMEIKEFRSSVLGPNDRVHVTRNAQKLCFFASFNVNLGWQPLSQTTGYM